MNDASPKDTNKQSKDTLHINYHMKSLVSMNLEILFYFIELIIKF